MKLRAVIRQKIKAAHAWMKKEPNNRAWYRDISTFNILILLAYASGFLPLETYQERVATLFFNNQIAVVGAIVALILLIAKQVWTMIVRLFNVVEKMPTKYLILFSYCLLAIMEPLAAVLTMLVGYLIICMKWAFKQLVQYYAEH